MGIFIWFARFGWLVGLSGSAKVLGQLPVPGRPTYLDYSSARAYCTCNRCGWGLFGHFFSYLSLLFSFSLSLGDGPIETEILSQRAVKPKTTNQPTNSSQCFMISRCKQNVAFLCNIILAKVKMFLHYGYYEFTYEQSFNIFFLSLILKHSP